ncbi:MAG: HAMP domain-containing protein [Planctomycetes bacterium]|nr:HAMP domain-containing protein [Planctomycetota bacterium]
MWNTKIGRKIACSYLILAIIVAVAAGTAIWQYARIEQSARGMQEELQELHYITELQLNFRDLVHRVTRYADGSGGLTEEGLHVLVKHLQDPLSSLDRILKEEEWKSEPNQGDALVLSRLDQILQEKERGSLLDTRESHDGSERAVLNMLKADFESIGRLCMKVLQEGGGDRQELLRQIVEKRDQVDALLSKFKEQDLKEAGRAFVALAHVRSEAHVLLTGMAVVVAALAFILSYRFASGIIKPIHQLQAGAERIRAGELDHQIHVRTRDELENLADAFNRMAHRLAEVYEKQEQEIEERTRQLSRSEKLAAVGTLAAGVAHEINNPLASIAGYAESLRRRSRSDRLRQCEEFRNFPEDLDVIVEESYRCKEIIRNLLDFARRDELVFGPVQINELLRRTCELVRHQPKTRQRRFRLELAPGSPVVHGDEGQLRHAFFNLLRNAVDATEDGDEILVRSHCENGRVTVEVSDKGQGIAREVLHRVIEPFYTTKPPGEGTGLGLAVSYGIMESHRGRLEVRSGGPGCGCSVIASLPLLNPVAGDLS